MRLEVSSCPGASWPSATSSVLRQAEHTLGEDVAENLGGAGTDAASPRQELVELPLAVVGRPLRAVGDLRVRADHLGRDVRQLLVELTPEELRGRALGPRRAAAQDLGEAPVAVELERLLADPERGELLSQDGIAALPLLLDEAHETMQRVAQRDVPDEGEQISLVRQGGDGDAPPFIELPDQIARGHPHVV